MLLLDFHHMVTSFNRIKTGQVMACWVIKGQKRVKSMHIINMENHEISIPAEILKKMLKIHY